MKGAELRGLGIEELEQKIADTRDDLFSARVKQATGQLENTAMLKNLRRDVARMESVLGEKREAAK
ncbi:MAG: 50S ribosomal protein L29 [Myxococcota bacterium]|jgi:large subunit ribosomal protein L29|nr:50S ribosomal protein L29 [Myxococcota bacterium]